MPVQFTTDLPDAQGLTLDASIQSEMTANWDDTINNGEYRIEWKEEEPDTETSYSSTNSATVGQATTAYTIANLLDGEKYSVRIRTQTAHKTGGWLEAADITKLTAADAPTLNSALADPTGTTTIDIEWVKNSTFEGSQPIYRQRTDYDYASGDLGRLVGTVSASATTFTDDSAQPGREYTYLVRALTQWVHADSALSTAMSADSIGLADTPVPPQGWYVEVDHPSSATLTPQILDDPVRRPTVNGFPRAEVPVPQDEKWHVPAFDDAPLRVWHDGDREPIDRLEHRRLRPDRTTLEGRGGTQLERRVIEDVDIQPTHEFVRDLIQTYTDYTANVDNPGTTQEEHLLQAADTDAEHQQAFADIPTDLPVKITSDGLFEPLQTAFLGYTTGGMSFDSFYQADNYVAGEAGAITGSGDSLSITFTCDYEIADPVVHFRYDNPGDHNGFEITVDGSSVVSTSNGALSNGQSWRSFSVSGTLAAGSHTVTMSFNASGADDLYVDVLSLVDGRYSYTFDNTLHKAGGHLDGPEPFPDVVRHVLEPIETPLGIQEVTLDVQSDDGNGLPELALGENGTETWNTVTDALTHTISYTKLATTARARVGVGRDPTVSRDTATPRTGYEPQGLDSLELTAILDDTPVLTNRSFDGKLIDVLREVASIGNFVFEVRESSSGTSLEWTQIDQRPVDVDPDLADYEIDRQTEDVVEQAVVYGGAQRITRQTVTVTVGSWVDLPFSNSRLVEGKETIYDGSTEFTRGDDYEIRYTTAGGQPEIKALSGGAISDGQTVSVDADIKPRGEHTVGDAGSNPRTIIEDIPGLASKQMCDQVALYLVEETGDALTEAEVTVPHDSVEWSVISAIDPEQLPTDGPMQVRSIESNPSETTLQLASRQSVGEAVQDIRDRTQRNSERV